MQPSCLITAKARQGFIQIGIRWWVSGGPDHRSLQGCCGSGFVYPALIVWNHCGGANDPDTRLRLFHKNMAAGVLLTQLDLAIAADELDGGRMERGSHGERGLRHSPYRDFRAAPMAEMAWARRQDLGLQAIPPYSSSGEITSRTRRPSATAAALSRSAPRRRRSLDANLLFYGRRHGRMGVIGKSVIRARSRAAKTVIQP